MSFYIKVKNDSLPPFEKGHVLVVDKDKVPLENDLIVTICNKCINVCKFDL